MGAFNDVFKQFCEIVHIVWEMPCCCVFCDAETCIDGSFDQFIDRGLSLFFFLFVDSF